MTTLIDRIEDPEFLPIDKFDDTGSRDISIRNAQEFIENPPTGIVGKLRNLLHNSPRASNIADGLNGELTQINTKLENINAYLRELRGMVDQYRMRIYDIQEQLQFASQEAHAIIRESLMQESAQLEKAAGRVEEVCLAFEAKREELYAVKNNMINMLIKVEKYGDSRRYSLDWFKESAVLSFNFAERLSDSINNLFSHNRALKLWIDVHLFKTPKTADEVRAYLQRLKQNLRSVGELNQTGHLLLADIMRELRALEFEANQIQKEEHPPGVTLGLVTEFTAIERLSAIENTRELLTAGFRQIEEFVGRTEKRIALLQQTIEIYDKQSAAAVSQEYS